MNVKSTSFDHIFKTWLDNEIGKEPDRDMLALARSKGFNSIVEWRLSTALRLGMDTREWSEIIVEDPNEFFPKVIIGPYKGWSIHFENKLTTTFAQALEMPEFFEWCQTHNRIPKIARNFPLPTSVILFQKPNGDYIHIEGGHRICAAAYARKIGQSIDFTNKQPVTAAVSAISEEDIALMMEFLMQGTDKA